VIVAGGTPTALAAKRATSTIPIVFQTVTDPVQAGLVESLNRPGGNLTGVSTLGQEVGPKQLELLHELAPKATTMAFLVDPTFPNIKEVSQGIQVSAATQGIDLRVVNASSERELDEVFDTLREMRVAALVIATTSFFTSRGPKLAELSLRYRLPAIYQYREFAVAGGLMSYGASFTDSFRLIGNYVGRILNGEKTSGLASTAGGQARPYSESQNR
jgi:putative ABC transport system substrate-binding protein